MRTRSPAGTRPSTARLSASEPPPVKTTSAGSTPSTPAAVVRASSRPRRAARPAQCGSDGLPKSSRSERSMEASAASDSGVVAAWSA